MSHSAEVAMATFARIGHTSEGFLWRILCSSPTCPKNDLRRPIRCCVHRVQAYVGTVFIHNGSTLEPMKTVSVEETGMAADTTQSTQRGEKRVGSTFGFIAAGAATGETARGATGRRGVADPRLVTRWSEIVGDRIASMCRPVRIRRRAGLALGGALVLAIDRARASELSLESERIKERVNRFFGHRAVAEISFSQTAAFEARDAEDAQAARLADAHVEIPAAERASLEALTQPVSDDALRSALTRLGANVIADSAAKRSRDGEDTPM